MAQQTLDVNESGSFVGDGGIPNNQKVNENFIELYGSVADLAGGAFALTPAVTAGEVTHAFAVAPCDGTVTSVQVITGELVGSANDGCTAKVQLAGTDTLVESFDLTATPQYTLVAEALTLTANVTFSAGDLVRVMVIAGADVTGGASLTFLIRYTVG